jgi:hypothetical protein
MIVGNKSSDEVPQGVFAKEGHLLQTIFFDRPDKPFRVSVGQLYRLNAGTRQNSLELRRVERVSIMD